MQNYIRCKLALLWFGESSTLGRSTLQPSIPGFTRLDFDSSSGLNRSAADIVERLREGEQPISVLGGPRSRPAALVKPERDAKADQQRGAEQEEKDGLL
jgi:hypothetical protein